MARQKKEPEMREYRVRGRMTYEGYVYIEAASEEDAKAKVEAFDFDEEMFQKQGSLVDWEFGDPEPTSD